MCNHKSLSYFLDEIGKETLWQNGYVLSGLNFKFDVGAVTLIVKRTSVRQVKEVCFIVRPNARQCLKALWYSTTHTHSGIDWRIDQFAT